MVECPKCGGELTEKGKKKLECQGCGTKFNNLETAQKYYKNRLRDHDVPLPEKKKSFGLIKCKECGEDISDKAKACPKCGADNRSWWERRNIISKTIIGTIIFFGFMFLVSLFSVGEETTSSEPKISTQQPEILDISFYEFDSMFGMEGSLTDIQKKRVFENEYKNKYVQWKCELEDIGDTFGSYSMSMKCKPDTFTSDMRVTLRDDQKDKAIDLRKGTYVEFRGRLKGYGELLGHRADDGVIVS